MYNYEHEAPCPATLAIEKFLWTDYFHDSPLMQIQFDDYNQPLCMVLESFYDRNYLMWDKLKGTDEEKREIIRENKNKYTYRLYFLGVRYFHMERTQNCNDYINGRFKDTALLHRLSAKQKRPLYHFRIQFADGYADLIFSSFKIRKLQGRVDYTPFPPAAQPKPFSLSAEESGRLLHTARRGDDISRFDAMKTLCKANHPGLLQICRENITLRGDFPDTIFYAAYLLGKLGNSKDVPALWKLYAETDELLHTLSFHPDEALLPKRNMLDAIEALSLKTDVPFAS